MTSPAAGWYPDPGGSGKLRYWNGSAWTQHVSPPDPEPEPDPVPPVRVTTPTPAPTAADSVSPPQTQTQWPAVTPGLDTVPPPSGPPIGMVPAASGKAGAGSDRLGPDGQVLSGWWRRFFGYLIDGILISIVAGIIVAVIGTVTGGFGELVNNEAWSELLAKTEANPGYQPSQAELSALFGDGLVTFIGWLTLVSLALGFANGVILVASSGQTIGDRMVGNRKVMAGRTVPGFGPAMLRWLIPAALSALQVVPLLGFVALVVWILDYLWPLWDPRRQALHDKAARTFVERSALAGPVNR